MATRVHINEAKLAFVVGGMTKRATKRAAETTARRARANVVAMGLVNTGELLASFRVKDETRIPLRPRFVVYSTDPAAKYPEFGRGPIVAAPGKTLRFKPKGASTFVFAKKVGPVRAYRFMRKAKQSITVRDYLP